ncbi:fused MFS/spermidine synthase [Sphingomonas colocasiae]|uniref:Fused MFS/spermidine synthase n=1 Tax=Sphingomonas colocasiae TaxID=1848973 RepID=A0ABS7PKI4_9SPHN|nr:fused MFS/spermidine synthase [Sphingomonas colocasiae]MBY8821815.1 fused MFS/spermidine synthase [Sphingomonas colocasiae]
MIRVGRGPLFVATILTGSFLLFLVQPMIARMALPRLGGAPAVWNSAMLVYQALLLGGYAYAHAIGRLPPARQVLIHLVVFACAALWLPIGLIAANPAPDAEPALWVPWLLLLSIGPLFFAVAAQAPLMQRWYAFASGGRDPYALYAASNLGSLAGLIAYPLVVEPRLPIAGQSLLWSGGYVLLALLIVACAVALPRGRAAAVDRGAERGAAPAISRRLHWIALAAIPSAFMLSTTMHLTTDIVAMPLLWVIPLALYLLSFSVAFAARRTIADTITWIAPLLILVLGGFALVDDHSRPLLRAALSLTLLFVVAVSLHTRLYRLRPAPGRLTGFYLAMSVGGLVGGLFSSVLAPIAFDWIYEYPLLIVAAALLAPQHHWHAGIERLWGGGQRALVLTLAVVVAAPFALLLSLAGWKVAVGVAVLALGIVSVGRPIPFAACVAGLLMIHGGWAAFVISLAGDARTRSYFGVYTVATDEDRQVRRLIHGTTVHGMQTLTPGHQTDPTSYYIARSGVGRALTALPQLAGPHARIGIVGLGTGTLACYARPGQSWRFYEIDPAVVRIARDPRRFSFLSRCAPHAPVMVGDARMSLRSETPGGLDFLALDAFSSDAVPTHLLTHEAFSIYRHALSPRGLLLVHISNRYLDLEPVIAAAAAEGGWHGAVLPYFISRDPQPAPHGSSSVWVALSPDQGVIAHLIGQRLDDGAGNWRMLGAKPGFSGWTDDFSSILPLVRAWAP